MEYYIVCQFSLAELEELVNGFLKDGWKCQGAPFAVVDPETNKLIWYQAMVI